jgi:hypothetical protein
MSDGSSFFTASWLVIVAFSCVGLAGDVVSKDGGSHRVV